MTGALSFPSALGSAEKQNHHSLLPCRSPAQFRYTALICFVPVCWSASSCAVRPLPGLLDFESFASCFEALLCSAQVSSGRKAREGDLTGSVFVGVIVLWLGCHCSCAL